jgi:predicted ATPase
VGRERELEEVRGLLARQDVRLLTLIGIGGVGKTRLAVAAARASMTTKSFGDGVAFVGLAPVGDPMLVGSTVARSLGLREVEGRTLLETLQGYLRGKHLLLVLDNFEHVLDAAPEVAALIEACPGLVVLATSRAPLRVRGEQEYAVPPLALPSSTRNPTEDQVLEASSGRLFLERARTVSPTFAITKENAADVAAICWRLAGLPLALELAAARTRFLDPATLLSRLDRALSTTWARDLPERQRTMNAALDWSYGLLSGAERALFLRLSVFVGGFTLEAAEAVGAETVAAGEVGAGDVLDLLGRLVEQSLVAVQPGAAGDGVRYWMLEPVRQYAHEKLEESGEAETVGRSHASFFLALAERAYPELMGARQVDWLDRLDRENGNLMAAVSWALEAGEAETGARLGWALWLFWMIRGYQREGRRWMEALLERDLPPALRAKVLVSVASLAYGYGDYEWCERYSEEGLELSRQLGDTLRVAWAEFGLGVAAMSRTDHASATPHLQESLRSFREIGEDFGVARATICLGMVALMRGNLSRATETFEEGLAVARRIGDRTGTCITLYNLAQVSLFRGDHDHATTLFEEGVTLSEQVADRANVAYCLEGLATVAGAQGKAERSARLFGAAEGLLEVLGAPVYTYYKPDPSLYERTVYATRSRLGEAAFGEARERGREMDFEQAVEYALAHDDASPE